MSAIRDQVLHRTPKWVPATIASIPLLVIAGDIYENGFRPIMLSGVPFSAVVVWRVAVMSVVIRDEDLIVTNALRKRTVGRDEVRAVVPPEGVRGLLRVGLESGDHVALRAVPPKGPVRERVRKNLADWLDAGGFG